jgi:hypothetical protein
MGDTSQRTGLTDDFGNYYPPEGDTEIVGPHGEVLLTTSPSADGSGAFGGALADFVLYGVVNGAFQHGPPISGVTDDPLVPGTPIGQDNPLPYWAGPIAVSGGQFVRIYHEPDAAAPGGHRLRFEFVGRNDGGSDNDEVYFEQVVPIAGTWGRWNAHQVRVGFSTGGDPITGQAQLKAYLQYLDSAGAALGSETVATTPVGFGISATGSIWRADTVLPPSNAAFLRIRVGLRRHLIDSAGFAGGGRPVSILISDVRVDKAQPGYLIADDLAYAGNRPARLSASGGIVYVTLPSGTEMAFGPTALTVPAFRMSGGTLHLTNISDTISADQNNYAPAGIDTAHGLFITASGATRTLTGIQSGGAGDDNGRVLYLTCQGSGGGGNDIVLAHNSGSSTAVNRFSCPGSANLTVRAGGGVMLLRSGGRWRVVAP